MRLDKFTAILATALALQGADVALPDDPNAELATFQIAEGFEANLFASEKDGLIKPIQIRFDGRGRLWVIGSTVYPQLEPGQKPDDKVLILEDADRDGRCDTVKIFADGLMIPTGLELTRGGAYIGHGPELLLLRDLDGDDRADERTVVFRGFGTGDNHQNINSFTWGPAGEMWMCQGLHTHSHIETPYGLVHLEKAGIWRFRPRELRLEGFYGSQFEPQNPWGHVFNEWNEHIVLAGNNSSPIFPDAGLVPNRREEPPPLIWPTGNGRKCSGGDFVANAHFPPEWQGRLILGGYINNAVWSANVVDDGAGFRFEDAPPLIRSTAREFRPVDVKFGPDGALYLCDWYNPIIGHYQASFRDPTRDKTRGRIWRITAKGRALTAPPKIEGSSLNGLFANLSSPDRWTRLAAKRELATRPTDEVRLVLHEWTSAPRTDRELIEALGVFQSHRLHSLTLIRRLAEAKEPRTRAYAASALGLAADKSKESLDILRQLAADPNARVRLQAIVACAQIDTPEAIEVVAMAADHPFDKFLNFAFNQAVYSLKPKWLPRLRAGELNFENHPDRLAAIVRADATADTLDALRAVLKKPQRDLLRILAENGNADDLKGILQLTPDKLDSRILSAIADRPLKPTGDLQALLVPFFDSGLQADALALAGKWKVASLLPKLREIAQDANASIPIRRAAIAGLGRGGSDLDFVRVLAKAGPSAIREAAVSALQFHDPAGAASLASDLFSEESALESVPSLITAFLQRPASAEALARAATGRSFPAKVVEAVQATIAASGRRNESLVRAFGLESKTKAVSAGEIRDRGDARRGEHIFRRPELGCVACHKVNGAGGTIGPDLSALGTAQPIEFIVGAIVEPQKEIKEGFTSVSITTKAGDEFQGYLVRESKDEIVLRDPLLNQEVKVRRGEIAKQAANGSLMPSGLVDKLSEDEFRDLVKFLSTLGKP